MTASARGSDSFAYDWANRLTSATVSGSTTTYTYTGDGNRATATAGATTSYLSDPLAGLPVLLEDGTRTYVWGLGLAYAVDGAGTLEVYHADGLDSTRALTNASETVTDRYRKVCSNCVTDRNLTVGDLQRVVDALRRRPFPKRVDLDRGLLIPDPDLNCTLPPPDPDLKIQVALAAGHIVGLVTSMLKGKMMSEALLASVAQVDAEVTEVIEWRRAAATRA